MSSRDEFTTVVIKKLLQPIGLYDRYHSRFESQGYDCEEDLCMLDESDLDQMQIKNPTDRCEILAAAKTYCRSGSGEVYHWLRQFALEKYHSKIVQLGYDSLRKCKQIVKVDDFMDEVEIMIPGHRKRIARMIEKLKEGNVRITEPEEPLGVGSWIKPEALSNAKHEFLCIKAAVGSPEEDSMYIQKSFLIDTGSDVVTLQPEIVEILGLNIIRTVTSHGVHSTVEKQLYAGVFKIKDIELEIEKLLFADEGRTSCLPFY
ncbi:uncharacterized protein TRIADDRAFT_60127 [Trichoplax adhaerens]|uniref:SAM domain-containing protein n=1 Tax=Trichoplax adhaerens TaxID=10228 RepID=B3S7D5_TRIAD|nr:hypothetical protein TRIADDRAFT_60127 [Trichoplax adhaerens]EDV21272.1 hypothetical protein TRIADDRAFT_60127 [Trichoplax adhaerens]|eukprot:XP_002116239.1 hypothetical protein TRIADDRAFT_60127 [Trichoplax adhaerens]